MMEQPIILYNEHITVIVHTDIMFDYHKCLDECLSKLRRQSYNIEKNSFKTIDSATENCVGKQS